MQRTAILLFLMVVGQAFVNAQETKPLMLDDLIKETLENNPQLRAARNQTSAARAHVDQATSWDAPQLGVEFYQTPIQSFPNPVKNSMETDYFLQQMIPFPGKISAMGRSAKNNANMIAQGY